MSLSQMNFGIRKGIRLLIYPAMKQGSPAITAKYLKNPQSSFRATFSSLSLLFCKKISIVSTFSESEARSAGDVVLS